MTQISSSSVFLLCFILTPTEKHPLKDAFDSGSQVVFSQSVGKRVEERCTQTQIVDGNNNQVRQLTRMMLLNELQDEIRQPENDVQD